MKGLTDYRKYKFSLPEILLFSGATLLGGAAVGSVMFGNIIAGIVLSVLLLPYVLLRSSRMLCRRRKAKLEEEFCTYMQLAASAMAGGTAFDNVFGEVADTVDNGKKDLLCKEFRAMDRSVKMHFDSIEVFRSFAERTGSSGIKSLAVALGQTMTAGGDTVALIRGSINAMRLKQDTEREVRRIVALPRLNHRIMTAMPFAFALLLKWMSPEFTECLYQWPGRLAMIAAVGITAVAWVLGERIGRMEV